MSFLFYYLLAEIFWRSFEDLHVRFIQPRSTVIKVSTLYWMQPSVLNNDSMLDTNWSQTPSAAIVYHSGQLNQPFGRSEVRILFYYFLF